MTENTDSFLGDIERRRVLGGIGVGLAGIARSGGAAADTHETASVGDEDAGTHHPGQPRFVQVGEPIRNPVHVGEYGAIGSRDNLAPRVPVPAADPGNYDAESFEWSLVDKPADSTAELSFGSSTSEEQPRWDTGQQNTADFEADVPGRYVFELDAPDGTHEWTFHAFPGGGGSPPSLSLDGAYEDGTAVIEPDAAVAPEGDTTREDLETVFLADDRDALSTEAIESDGLGARVPVEALDGESARLHACAWDGQARSMMDTVELHPDGSLSFPNRPPEWARDGVMYQIFPRSWAGEPGETTMADLVDGVDYLGELGVDMVWLTPVVPDEASARQFDQDLLAEPYRTELGGVLSGGGPHGYGTLDYFGIAPDLVPDGMDPIDAYQAFVDACHDNGIKIIFDQVISHCGRSHPFFQETIAGQGTEPPNPDLEYPAVSAWDMDSKYFDWFARVDSANQYEREAVEPRPAATGFFGLRLMPNFNYNNVAVREHMLAMADFWSGEVGVDGFRCDIAWGVPLSLWREIREVVRANNSEFLMLDETVPKEPKMAENAFDMHFDTEGFTVDSHGVASGETAAGQLVDDVRKRRNEGIPPHSLVLNLIENHDEHRLLNQAVLDLATPNRNEITEEEWERGAHLQRVCWATGVALPGVPGIYYGQERQISRFGEGRHRGEGDPRGVNGGGVDVTADVRPGGRQRAFMNWEEYPKSHLQFYKDVVDRYHELDVLKPDASLRNVWAYSTDDVLAFGRDASDLDSISGPERIVVLLNFEPNSSEVTVRPSVGETDLLSGERLADTTEYQPGRTIEIDEMAIFETSDLYNVGSLVANFEPPGETDHGPGEYEYPTGERFKPGIFDIDGFSVRETPTAYQFRVEIGGELTNPEGFEHGLTHQHLQVYIRDPDGGTGAMTARNGVNAQFETPYHYRVVADGEHGVRVESHDGNVVASGKLRTNTVANEFLVTVEKADFRFDIADAAIAPLLLGYDGSRAGNVRPVTAEASSETFGGAANENAPNVIDTGLPATFPNESVLGYGNSQATIPFAGVITEFETVREFDLETGTGYGPGTYEPPTGTDYYEQAWDVDTVTVHESRDNVRLEYTMATEPENPWNFGPGFSHPFIQLYIHVPGASPGTVEGRTGTNIAFQEPYHYRVVVHGEGVEQIETADGAVVSRDVDVTTDGRTITVEFSKAAVNWETSDRGVGIAPTMMPFDGFGKGGLRAISETAGDHTIGGGHTADIDPAVMDMVVPEGVDRQELLADYSDSSPPKLPYVGLGPLDDIHSTTSGESENGPNGETDTEPSGNADTEPGEESSDGTGALPVAGVGTFTAAGGVGYLLKRRLEDREE